MEFGEAPWANLVRRRSWHVVAPILFMMLGVYYSVAIPLWEAPDEVGHWTYIEWLIRHGDLPVVRPGEQGEAHQPPLYYALASIAASFADLDDATGRFRANPDFAWAGAGGDAPNIAQHGTAETFPYRGTALGVHLARLVSVCCGVATVALVGRIAGTVFPNRPAVGAMTTLLVALNPQFLFIHSSVNNDAFLTTLSTACLLWLVRLVEEPERSSWWTRLGLVLALATLTKVSALVIGAVAAVVLILGAVRTRSVAMLIIGAWRAAIPVVLLTGWWFIRNAYEYGDVLGWGAFREAFSGVLRSEALTLRDVATFFEVQWRSFWGLFGWMTVGPPNWYYALFVVLSGLVIAGGVCVLAKKTYRLWPAHARRGTLVLTGALLAQEGFLIASICKFDASWYQGRYLFPVIGPLGFLAGLGLLEFARVVRGERMLPWGGLLMLSVALSVPVAVICPAYQTVPVSKVAAWLAPVRDDVAFANGLRLVGHDVRMDARSGSLTVTLYWKADALQQQEHAVFVHVMSGEQTTITQQDLVPGADRGFPPQVWWAGDVVVARHEIDVRADLVPEVKEIRVGLYDPKSGARVPVMSDDSAQVTYVVLRAG